MSNDLWRISGRTSRVWKLVVPAALLLFALLGAGAARAQVFSDTLNTQSSSRTAGSAPLSFLQVSSPTAVTSISVLNNIMSPQNQKFLIFNNTTSTFLLVSSPQPFGADGVGTFTWKQSASFAAVTLLPGNDYLVGAISDTAGNWAYNNGGTYTQGSISSLQTNGNVVNYAGPAIASGGGARIPLQLNIPSSTPTPTPVPTLGPTALMWTILAVGLLGLVGLRRRGKARY